MEKNKKIQIYCLFGASLILGLFGAVCLFLGIRTEYNDAMGYFNTDSLFAPVLYLCMVAGPVFGLVGWVLNRKHEAPDKALPGGIATVIASIIAASLVLYRSFSELSAYFNAPPSAKDTKALILALLALLTAASLILSALSKKDKAVNPWVSLLSFFPVIYCACCVLFLYFDQTVAVNSPIKFISQLTYLAFMLVFCAEAGLSLGRGGIYPRYFFALCCAAAVGAAGAVGALMCNVTASPCAGFAGADSFVKAGFFIYACVRFVYFAGIEATVGEKEIKAKKTEAEEPEIYESEE